MRFLLAGAAVLVMWSGLWFLGSLGDRRLGAIPSSPRQAKGDSGRTPLATTSGYWCAPGWPYSAYAASTPRYYPPNHPLLPSRMVRPDRCYSEPGDAEAAGYVLAPPPSGGLVVNGVYLLEADLKGQCRRASAHVGFGVPCPTRLPNVGWGSSSARCSERTSFGRFTRPPCVHGRSFLLDQAGFAIPPGYDVGALRGSHLVITASRDEDPSVAPSVVECLESRLVDSSVVRPSNGNRVFPASILACAEGLGGLHEYLILKWVDSGVVYQVALNGDTPTNRRLLEAIGSHLAIIGPRASTGS